MQRIQKLILTDCDGVLLNWSQTFNKWVQERGYTEVRNDHYDMHLCYNISKPEAKKLIKQFNESAAICQLEPFRDAKFWVKRIYEEFGYRFRVITSLSTCPYAGVARELNLRNHFGDAIEQVICLDTGADKADELSKYLSMYWIEDKPENAIAGLQLGLRSILFEHYHNSDNRHPDIPTVETWRQIYKMIKKDEL